MCHVDTTWRRRFLLDLWAEPRERCDLPTLIRGRVRDLTAEDDDDGTEQYLSSPADLDSFIAARLDAAGLTPRRWEGRA